MRFTNSALFAITAVCFGQASNAPVQEVSSSRETPTTFSTKVNLVVVPVVVRDRRGKAVGDLTKQDFQVYDKGKLQTISRFTVEKAGEKAASEAAQLAETARESGVDPESGPAAIPTRFIAYVFDDLRISPGDLSQVRTATIKHLTATLHPTDRVAIYTTSGLGNLDFTADPDKIFEALNRISARARSIVNTDCPPVTPYMADLIQKNDPQALNVAVGDAIICGNMLPQASTVRGGQPTIDAQTLATAQALAQGSASRQIAIAEQDLQQTLTVLRNIIRRMAATPGQRSLVLISPGFLLTNAFRQDEMDLMDRAIRANVIFNSLDARGLFTIDPGVDASQAQFNGQSSIARERYQRESMLVDGDVLIEIAEGTGGLAFRNSNDYGEGLNRTAAAPEYIYLLGFSPQNLKYDGSFHTVKVVLKPRDVNMQARRGYYAPKHAANEEEQAKQEIREAIFSREEVQEFPVSIQTQFFKTNPETARLSVLARIDMKLLKFQKVQGRNNDTLTIVSGLFDRNGNLLSAITKTVEMKLKEETFEARMAAGLNVKTSFDVQPGKYVLRLVVRDSEGQMMSARNGIVDIP
jgi:VWFA-related protein